MDGSVRYLQKTPADVEALFRGLLIGVTGFFRDPPAFQALEKEVIPRLFAGKPAVASLRVYVQGCSTGEEAIKQSNTQLSLFMKHSPFFAFIKEATPTGTGLGLAMVKRILENHDGRIWAASEGLGCGSSFCFTLAKATRP